MKKIALFIMTIFITASCEKDTFNDNFSFLYGDWTLTQLNVGTSSPDPSEIGEVIQFIKNDSYNIIKENKIVESGEIDGEMQTEDYLSLTMVAKEIDPTYNPTVKISGKSLIVTYTEETSILLHNNATDAGYFGLWLSNCKKKAELANKTTDAQIIGFVTEKCFCCWGWVIKVGADTIKTEQIPTLTPTENIVFPINARITIGERTIDCSGRIADYYEIKEFTELK